MIRTIGRAVLEKEGFCVLTAEDGVEAVEVFTREHSRIALVVLDVTMPRMSGRDAFRHLVEIDPSVRVLFSTGYSSADIAELNGTAGLLAKPYRPHELLSAVQAALTPEAAPAA
jgi:two-component system cell cycle sensor histidine kinase/response regulator CckA